MAYKPAAIAAAHVPTVDPAAGFKKSAFGPGSLRLSYQMSGPGGGPSQLGQRFGSALHPGAMPGSSSGLQAPPAAVVQS